MSALEDSLKELVTAIVDERLACLPAPKPDTKVDAETQKQIAQYQILAAKSYLTKKEMALYLGCSERSIEEWSQRNLNDNPLPTGYVGSDMRGRREKLDQWVEREAQRKRLKLAS